MSSGEAVSVSGYFPDKVKAARLAAGFKRIIRVVDATGLDFRTIQNYETNDLAPRSPHLRVLQELARTYRVRLVDLLEPDAMSQTLARSAVEAEQDITTSPPESVQ